MNKMDTSQVFESNPLLELLPEVKSFSYLASGDRSRVEGVNNQATGDPLWSCSPKRALKIELNQV